MILKDENGDEWEFYDGPASECIWSGGIRVVKRVPQKSELLKWIEKNQWQFLFTDNPNPSKESVADRRHAYEDGLRNGFYKAIQVLEKEELLREVGCYEIASKRLKDFAGIK